MEEEYLTIKDAMNRTGKSEVTIRRLIRMLRTQYSVELGDSNDAIIEKTPLLRKRNESRDKDGEPVFEWLVAASALENLIDDSQSPSPDVEQQVPDQGQQESDDDNEDKPEPRHADGQPRHDVGRADNQRDNDVNQDNGREDSQRGDDQRPDYTQTIIIPVAVLESLNATVEVLQQELGEKNEQLASRGREAERQQKVFAVTQEQALRLPPGTLVKREEETEDAQVRKLDTKTVENTDDMGYNQQNNEGD